MREESRKEYNTGGRHQKGKQPKRSVVKVKVMDVVFLFFHLRDRKNTFVCVYLFEMEVMRR